MIDVALLVLRVPVGLLVAAHGAQKLFRWFGGGGLPTTAKHLESLGLRPASGWAFLGALSEFGGGLLLALGLGSPLGAVGVAAAMAIAITKIHWPKVWASERGFEYPLVNFAAALAVGIAGPGAYSLDAVWGTALPAGAARVVAGLAVLGYLAAMLISASAKAAPAR